MLIKQVENELGITRETIRYYIQEGLISPVQGENRYRDYSEEDIKQLKRIMILRQLDVSVADIRDILSGDVDICSVMAESKKHLDKKQIYVNDARSICEDLEKGNNNLFDPDLYFKDYNVV